MVATQSLRKITERAQLLTARGVRRIIAERRTAMEGLDVAGLRALLQALASERRGP